MMKEMQITSQAFENMKEIPIKYTCKGANISPQLSFTDIPQAAKSLALIVDDPDAPDPNAPKMTWVHWVVYNIPPNVLQFEEGIKKLPDGAIIGINDWKKPEWGGPCPPIGRHRYFFKLYALSEKLPKLNTPTKDELIKAMENKIISQAELIGTFQK